MADETAPTSTSRYEGEVVKPGAPPRHATEPEGSEGSAKTSKTRTDPETGAPTSGRPDTV